MRSLITLPPRNPAHKELYCRTTLNDLIKSPRVCGLALRELASSATRSPIDAHLPISDLVIHAAWLLGGAVTPTNGRIRQLLALNSSLRKGPGWFEQLVANITNIIRWRGSLLTHTTYERT